MKYPSPGAPPDREYGYNRFLLAICRARPFSCLAVILLSITITLFAIVSPLILRSLIDDVLIGKNTALLNPAPPGDHGHLSHLSAVEGHIQNGVNQSCARNPENR